MECYIIFMCVITAGYTANNRSCFNLGVVISVSITEIVIHDMIGRECCAKVCT